MLLYELFHIKNRKIFIIALVYCVAFACIARLFYMQVFSSYYSDLADNNAFLKIVKYPTRGMIFDRNGNLLVQNQSVHNLMVTMTDIKEVDTLALCKILNISIEEFNKRLEDVKNYHKNVYYSPYIPQLFFRSMGEREYGMFQESSYKFHGFCIQNTAIRKYNYPYAAHVLGYIAEVSRRDIINDSYYQMGDCIGKTGVEYFYEKQLRGIKGVEILLRDVYGKIKGSYENGKYNIIPISGKSLTLSIDIDLQAYGEKLMCNKSGTIIMIEPKSGDILCMLSAPSYDPSYLIGDQFGKHFLQLLKNSCKPLFNRALNGSYPPGSVFKMAQGMILLQEKIIKPDTKFTCNGGWKPGGGRPACHCHHSPLGLVSAIETSCNSYFCSGFKSMLEHSKYGSIQRAIDTWRNYMIEQGFGNPLGVDLPGERKGLIPSSQYYNKLYNKWNAFSIISVAIGQGEISFTPIQLCNLAATIANHGYFYIPHIVKKISNDSLNSLYLLPHYTKIQSKYYLPIIEGMRLAIMNGTCSGANISDIKVCGKTGTAQNRGVDHSIFIGFAPMNHPQVAVLVLIENGGFGSSFAVPIGRLMIQKYLKGTIPDEDKWIEKKIENTVILQYGLQKK